MLGINAIVCLPARLLISRLHIEDRRILCEKGALRQIAVGSKQKVVIGERVLTADCFLLTGWAA
jgi:hypothetical protein